MRKISSLWVGVATLALPALALAQGAPTVEQSIGTVQGIFNILFTLLIALGVVILFWGLIQYLTRVGEAKHEGLVIMFYGIITLVVMISVWGLINLVGGTFGLMGQSAQNLPTAPNLTGIIQH